MTQTSDILPIATSGRTLGILPSMANRHGLIAGATGTGKTCTLQVMAEQFSSIGVPVFLADVKGDLAGISQKGERKPKIDQRLNDLGLKEFTFRGAPVTLWDLFGTEGHPVRATISDMGPILLGRILGLNETQGGVLQIVFKIADDQGWLLLDLKDLRSLLDHAAEHASDYRTEYGNISPASVGAIQRGLLTLEESGGDAFFGEPALNLDDILQTDSEGRGIISILAASRLLLSPRIYSTFLLWLLSELFENLPEVGDREKPKLVFFFDEAHLLFAEAPSVVLEKIEQVVRLIRSKGVGVYFVTQNPLDIPEIILGQLGNRVQHALRAFTPRDQKNVKAAAETFRPNPKIKVEQAITELAVGEALVSFLGADGTPGIVERALVHPPQSQIGPITPDVRRNLIASSLVAGAYEKRVDRESAFEILRGRTDRKTPGEPGAPPAGPAPRSRGRQPETLLEAATKSVVRAAGSQLGRQIMRGVLGTIFGGRR